MIDELVDIVNDENEFIRVDTKKRAHKEGLYHRVAHAWVYNTKGEVLLQLRASTKDLFPSKWDVSVGGHIGAGEEPINSIMRELEEEIGLKTNNLEFYTIAKHNATYKDIIHNQFCYTYFVRYNGPISDLKIQKEELDGIKFFTIDEIIQTMNKNPEQFVLPGQYWHDILGEIQKRV